MITIKIRGYFATIACASALVLSACTAEKPTAPETPQRPVPVETVAAGLTVEEYPLADLPKMMEFADTIGPLRAKRKQWHEPTQEMKDKYASRQVGISAQERPELYADQRMLSQAFALGDNVIFARINTQTQEVEVVGNDQVIYRYLHPNAARIASPSYLVQGFYIWDGKWAMETPDQLVVDGESLNQKLGYEAIFGFHFLQGKPFYFFKQNGKIGISYDGQVLPMRYDAVPHYGCCDADAYNPQPNGWMVSFYGQRAGRWHYVEVGKYE